MREASYCRQWHVSVARPKLFLTLIFPRFVSGRGTWGGRPQMGVLSRKFRCFKTSVVPPQSPSLRLLSWSADDGGISRVTQPLHFSYPSCIDWAASLAFRHCRLPSSFRGPSSPVQPNVPAAPVPGGHSGRRGCPGHLWPVRRRSVYVGSPDSGGQTRGEPGDRCQRLPPGGRQWHLPRHRLPHRVPRYVHTFSCGRFIYLQPPKCQNVLCPVKM